jgi:hypothetical protein
MLNFVIEEWNKEISILFKAYNKNKEILADDSTILKFKKIRENRMLYILHQLYLNIIKIAILFRAHVCYLTSGG